MYGKIHRSFFRSSINDVDPIVRFVFVGMIVLSDRDGRLDVTRSALARELNVPPSEVDRAIDILASPDESSRSRDFDGRRIIPIDCARSWGWVIVNKAQYRSGEADAEYRREQTRERVRSFRERERSKEKEEPKKNTDTDTAVTAGNGSNADVTQKTLQRTRETAPAEAMGVVASDHQPSQFDAAAAFPARWQAYPRREGRKEALRHFRASVRSESDLQRFDLALENFKRKLRVDRTEPRFIPQAKTFFFNWEDYIDWKQPHTAADPLGTFLPLEPPQ